MQTFGQAIEAAKAGAKISRSGWNGKNMYLIYVPADGYTIKGQALPLLPFLAMKTAGGELVPWLASQTDVLAEDWTAAL